MPPQGRGEEGRAGGGRWFLFPFLPSCLHLTALCGNLRAWAVGDDGHKEEGWSGLVASGRFEALVLASEGRYRNPLRHMPISGSTGSLLTCIDHFLSPPLRRQTLWGHKTK